MGWYEKRLDKVLNGAVHLPLEKEKSYVLISDCHRGDGNWNDNFANNKTIYMAALQEYYERGFTYIELGDGDELWENKSMNEILEKHEDVFDLLKKFCCKNRLYMLYGNHDMVKKKGMQINGFPRIKICESILLKEEKQKGIMLMHGHQGDLWNETFWKLTRFLVRHVWRPLEQVGVKDPTSASKNYKKKGKVEKRISDWAGKRQQIVIAGHTHRPYFPQDSTGGFYFNTGSTVHPHSMTAIEIEHGRITLVKWWEVSDDNSFVRIQRKILAGPILLENMIT